MYFLVSVMLDKLDPYENPTPNGMAILSNFKLTIYNFPCDANVTNHNLTFAACIMNSMNWYCSC